MHFDRRKFVKTAGAGLAGAALSPAAGNTGSSGERPNILFIIVDQMRLPRWFPEDARLPAYERLQREGLTFTNHFTCAVPCSPSRATIFTGMHLPQHGVFFNIKSRGVGSDSLDPSFTTLGHRFQGAGYRTPYFGKWHLSVEEDYHEVGLAPYGFEEWQGPDRHGFPRGGIKYDAGFAGQAVQWLENYGRSGSPWFLTCSLINPHDIMWWPRQTLPGLRVPNIVDKLPDNFADDLEVKPRIQKAWQKRVGKLLKGMDPSMPERGWRQFLDIYYDLNRMVDKEIGRLLDTLDRLDLSANTMVFFVADHGEMAGSHQLTGKGPFAYHENIRVPLIVRWPGRVEAGARTNALAHTVDLYPTLLDLAGIYAPVAPLAGKSLAPIITLGHELEVNDHILTAWGLGSHIESDRPSMQHFIDHLGLFEGIPMQVHAIFDGRYKYARYFDPGISEERELYDLENDPLELHSLAGDPGYSTIEKEMAERLGEAEKNEMGWTGKM